jgi:hypothetical protein
MQIFNKTSNNKGDENLYYITYLFQSIIFDCTLKSDIFLFNCPEKIPPQNQ